MNCLTNALACCNSLTPEARGGNINPDCNPLFLLPVLTDFFLRAHGRLKMDSNPLTFSLSKGWIYVPNPWMWVGSSTALTKHMAGVLLCQILGPALKRLTACTFFLRNPQPLVKKDIRLIERPSKKAWDHNAEKGTIECSPPAIPSKATGVLVKPLGQTRHPLRNTESPTQHQVKQKNQLAEACLNSQTIKSCDT